MLCCILRQLKDKRINYMVILYFYILIKFTKTMILNKLMCQILSLQRPISSTIFCAIFIMFLVNLGLFSSIAKRSHI